MKLTTPYAVLAGFALVALAIASQPLTGSLVPDAWAQSGLVQKVAICSEDGTACATVLRRGNNLASYELEDGKYEHKNEANFDLSVYGD